MREIETAVVTGSTGVVGTALCNVLKAHGVHVYAFVRPESKRTKHLEKIEGVELIGCDVSQFVHMPKFASHLSVDAFFHLAWVKTTGSGRNDMETQIRNVQYTIDACRAAFSLNCKVFIGAGSQAEYGRVDHALAPDTPCFPENGYGMAKLCAGQMSRIECEKLGIDHIWPRILSVYGPYDGQHAMIPQVIRKLIVGEKPLLTAGEQIWDYLYAEDAADALYRLALYGKNSSIYPVGSGKARPLKEYIETIRDLVDPSLSLGFGEIPYSENQVMHLEADISALKRDTGFERHTDFQTGIRRTIDYIRSVQDNG